MKKFRILAVSILSLMMVLACFALPGCFEPEPEPEPEPPVKYTVTFNLNYSGAPAATTAQVESGSKAQKPADPTRSGYTFDGWFDNANGTGTAFDFNTAITANKTLYAKWTQQTFTVTFNLNYTGSPAATTQQVASGGSVQKPTDPSRTGYTFNGWFRAASGGTAVTFPLTITAATTLYAQWTQQGGDTPVDPSPSVTPTVGLPDDHSTGTEKDVSWARYDFYAHAAPAGDTFPAYVTAVAGSAGALTAPNNRGDQLGYYPVGNLNKNTGTTITYTLNATAACEVGVYVELCWRNADTGGTFDKVFELTVNGTKVNCTSALPEGGSQWTATNNFMFVGYANLTSGTNTVVIKVIQDASTNYGYNFYALRLSAQTAVITGKAPA